MSRICELLNSNMIYIEKFKTIYEQKSGVILTSTEPNFFSMLFSIKNRKFMML